MRAMCGIINPTKPIKPATETALAANNAATAVIINRVFSTAKPKLRAVSSPKLSMVNRFAPKKANIKPPMVYGIKTYTCGQLRAARPPTIHNRAPCTRSP